MPGFPAGFDHMTGGEATLTLILVIGEMNPEEGDEVQVR